MEGLDEEQQIRHELHEMARQDADRLEAKEHEFRAMESDFRALRKAHEKLEMEANNLSNRLARKDAEIESLNQKQQVMVEALANSKKSVEDLMRVKEILEQEAKHREQSIMNLEAQVEHLRTELSNAKEMDSDTLAEMVRKLLQEILGGLGILSQTSDTNAKLDEILSSLTGLHTKVDSVSSLVSEVKFSVGFLSSLSVKSSLYLEALIGDQLDMPKMLHVVPLLPIKDIKAALLADDEAAKLLGQKSKGFCGRMGLASRLLRHKIASKFQEIWEIRFVCAHTLVAIEPGFKVTVPRGWVIRAYPILKLMLGALVLARVASATVDRLASQLRFEIPSNASVDNMLRVMDAVESVMSPEAVSTYSEEILLGLKGTKNPEISMTEVSTDMYRELVNVLDTSCPDWRLQLARSMQKVVGEDGLVYWVSHENVAAFLSPSASAQRSLALQQHHMNRMLAEYKSAVSGLEHSNASAQRHESSRRSDGAAAANASPFDGGAPVPVAPVFGAFANPEQSFFSSGPGQWSAYFSPQR
eukprot:c17387_g1_i2.p1 GENE.c17387_g1_i2~~c17387_g1_i2.p1  ORF type:complete len:529 (-),score=125.59 c17387_g1_i2:15-1601(-)